MPDAREALWQHVQEEAPKERYPFERKRRFLSRIFPVATAEGDKRALSVVERIADVVGTDHHVQVTRGGAQVAVPQHPLQRHQVGTQLQVMGGKAVTKGMHASGFFDAGELTRNMIRFLDVGRRGVVPRLLSRKQVLA